VQRDDRVLALAHAQLLAHARRGGARQLGEQRVDHHVADESDFFGGDALGAQVLVGVGRGREQEVCDLIRQQAVDLFGHRAVAAAQPRLDVRDRDAELRADERGGERRVHVAVHHDPVGAVFEDYRLEAAHHVGRLRGVRA
jgi:hypothetical protein